MTIGFTVDGDLKTGLARLVDFLTAQAAALRAESENSPFDYGRGSDRGVAQGYELAAKFIQQELDAAADAVASGANK